MQLVLTHHLTEHAPAKTAEYPNDIPQFSKLGVSRKYLKVNKHNNLSLARKYAWIFVLGHHLLVTDHVRGQISEHMVASNGGYCLFTILYKHGKRALEFLGRFHFYFGLVFNKTIVPLALVRYEMVIDCLLSHIQAHKWNNC